MFVYRNRYLWSTNASRIMLYLHEKGEMQIIHVHESVCNVFFF